MYGGAAWHQAKWSLWQIAVHVPDREGDRRIYVGSFAMADSGIDLMCVNSFNTILRPKGQLERRTENWLCQEEGRRPILKTCGASGLDDWLAYFGWHCYEWLPLVVMDSSRRWLLWCLKGWILRSFGFRHAFFPLVCSP
jgi:hypothetical protein